MKKQLIALLLLALIFAPSAQASRSIVISADKSSLTGDEELNVSSSLEGFITGETIFIKGAFYKEGSTNYFGYTKNNDSWIKNSVTAISQRNVKIGEWDGNMTLKSDFGDSGFTGTGNYKLKLGFYYYTSGGNLSSVNWSENNLDVSISSPIITTTPVPSETAVEEVNTPTIKPSATPKPSPTPTKIPTPTKTPTPNKASASSNVMISKTPATVKTVLAKSNSDKISNQNIASDFARIRNISPQVSRKGTVEVLAAKKYSLTPLIILGGIVFLFLGILWFVRKNYSLLITFYEKIFNN